MQKKTREALTAYAEQLKKSNATDNVAAPFPVSESEAARLIVLQRESIDLLNKINIIPCRDVEGVSGVMPFMSLAARTNTDVNPRDPQDYGVNLSKFVCEKTEYDCALPNSFVDSLAGYPDFFEKLDLALAVSRGLDQITIGWNGVSAEASTNRATYPLLQDVNIGWLQKVRTDAPDRVRSSATIGVGGEFASLDALVYALIQGLDECHRKRSDLVVIISRDLLHTKMLEGIAAGATSIEAEAALTRILTTGKIAGLDIYDSPSFPDDTVVVTSFKNLSIYYQAPSVRRWLKDEPELSRQVDYMSLNEAYVVESYGLIAFAEGVGFTE